MKFKAPIRNVNVFAKICASLHSLNPVAWIRLTSSELRLTCVPEKGSQVWAVISPEVVFETYTLQSASEDNRIDLEVPMGALHRALKSAIGATSAQIRLTKKGDVPVLSLTIVDNVFTSQGMGSLTTTTTTRAAGHDDEFGDFDFDDDFDFTETNTRGGGGGGPPRERETIITQDIPVKVLGLSAVEGIHEPRCREPDVHIQLPSLLQLKSISERFTRLALTSSKTSTTSTTTSTSSTSNPRLELSATMHGSLRLSLLHPSLSISSSWTSLTNPALAPETLSPLTIQTHPSTVIKNYPESDDRAWAKVIVDARDWGRVLSVGRLGGRVIACLIDGAAVVLYVFLEDDEAGEGGGGGGGQGMGGTLTYYISGYSR